MSSNNLFKCVLYIINMLSAGIQSWAINLYNELATELEIDLSCSKKINLLILIPLKAF